MKKNFKLLYQIKLMSPLKTDFSLLKLQLVFTIDFRKDDMVYHYNS